MLENLGDYSNHRKYLKECLKAMHKLNSLVGEILEIVKIDENNFIINRQKCNLKDLVMSVIREYNHLIDDKNIVLNINLFEAIINTDSKILKRVLSNVIMNAVQNTESNKKIEIKTTQKDEAVILQIINDGHIDEQLLANVFEPFHKQRAYENNFRSGLGLSIVKKLLDILNLDYGLENKENNVLFWICFNID